MEPVTEPASETETPASARPARGLRIGLSSKLLLLTIVFVMVAEVLIYVPSIANFRLNWLNDRLAAAHTAALVLEAAPSGMVPESLTKQILASIGARTVAIKMGSERRLLAASDVPSHIAQDIDMRNVRWWRAIADALDTLFFCMPDDVMRVVGPAPMAHGEFMEIVLDEAPLCKAMVTFSVNILLLSLLISGITAMLVYFALHYHPGASDVADHREHGGVPRRSGKSRRASSAAPAATTRSAQRRRNSAPCSVSLPRCCIRRAVWRRSAWRCRRSIMTCATCWRRRSYFPISCRTCPTPRCSASRPS